MTGEAYLYDVVRTPRGRGKPDGALHGVKPLTLLTTVLDALRRRNDLDTALVSDVIVGCVTPVGEQGADIARTAVLAAGWHENVAGVQINRFCASGLDAVNLAAAKVRSGWGGDRRRGRRGIDVPRPDGLGRRCAHGRPRDRAAHRLRSSGHRRRPHRDPGWLLAREDARPLRRALAATRRPRTGGWISSFDRARAGSQRRAAPRTGCEHIREGTTLEALAALKPSVSCAWANRASTPIALRKYRDVARIEHVHTAGKLLRYRRWRGPRSDWSMQAAEAFGRVAACAHRCDGARGNGAHDHADRTGPGGVRGVSESRT